MNVLIDTHVMLWFAAGDERLSQRVRGLIEDTNTVCYISMASWWEISIKCSLGKLRLDDSFEKFMNERIEEGFRVLSIESQHLYPLATLPFHHRDPFDRLIICQAMVENMPLCTGDNHFTNYDIQRIW